VWIGMQSTNVALDFMVAVLDKKIDVKVVTIFILVRSRLCPLAQILVAQ
jgi:hypothetical protein